MFAQVFLGLTRATLLRFNFFEKYFENKIVGCSEYGFVTNEEAGIVVLFKMCCRLDSYGMKQRH